MPGIVLSVCLYALASGIVIGGLLLPSLTSEAAKPIRDPQPDYSDQIASLESQVAQLESQVAALGSQVGQLQLDGMETQARVNTLEYDVAGLLQRCP